MVYFILWQYFVVLAFQKCAFWLADSRDPIIAINFFAISDTQVLV